jgi:hypothetical protein
MLYAHWSDFLGALAAWLLGAAIVVFANLRARRHVWRTPVEQRHPKWTSLPGMTFKGLPTTSAEGHPTLPTVPTLPWNAHRVLKTLENTMTPPLPFDENEVARVVAEIKALTARAANMEMG